METKLAPARFETKTSKDGKQGEVTAFVSVYGNVDGDGDIVAPGFFDNDVADWQKSGDPIPWVFSHQSRDLGSYIGMVDPKAVNTDAEFTDHTGEKQRGLQMTALMPIAEDPDAAKAFRLLDARVVKQFSFAYDVTRAETPDTKARKSPDHRRTLIEGKLFEAGPCLRGSNTLTNLVATKDHKPVEMKAGKQYGEMGEPIGVFVGNTYIAIDADGEYDDEAVAACAIRMAADLVVLAGCAEAPDGSMDADAAADDAQAAELRRIAGELSAVGFDIVSTDESETSSGEAGESSASLDGKGRKTTAATKAADELRTRDLRELELLELQTVEA
jgi:HK97 family phage prohead protease